MSELRRLNLAGNSLGGSIPNDLGGLSELRELDISDNKLAGIVPIEFAEFSNVLIMDLSNNRLDSLPDFSLFPIADIISVFDVSNNRLGFTDIVPNVGFLSSYSPQRLVDAADYRIINGGSSVVLTVSDRHAGNEYFWYKDGEVIETSDSWSYEISNFNVLDGGIYHVEIRNPGASELVLVRDRITLFFSGVVDSRLIAGFADDALVDIQMYPNPVLDRLYIGNSGDNTIEIDIELIDSKGVRLFRYIDVLLDVGCIHSVDMSSFAPGVYYIRLMYGEETKTMKILKI